MFNLRKYTMIFFVLMVFFSFCQMLESANLIQNGGFEGEYKKTVDNKKGTDFFASGWFAKDNINYTWLVFSESSDCQSGKKCQKWKNPAINGLGIQQNISPLEEGAEYRLSLWYKSNKEITVLFSSGKAKFVSEKLPPSAEWKKFDITFTPEKGTSGKITILRIMSQKGSTTFIDNCSLSTLAEKKKLSKGLIWQLGEKNGNADDFVLRNRMWEYGRAPFLKRYKGFDQQKNIFRYNILDAGGKKNSMPQYMVTRFYKYWVPEDEVVTGIELSWNETQAGKRKLTVSLAEHKDRNGLVDDVRCVLPGNKVVYFQIPKTEGRTTGKNSLEWTVIFNSRVGENKLLLENMMESRENYVRFDSIKLSKSSKPAALKPVIEASTDKFGNVFHPGENAMANIKVFNQNEPVFLKYSILDWQNKPLKSGKEAVKNGNVKIKLPTAGKGYFELRSMLVSSKGEKVLLGNSGESKVMRYVVIEPVEKVYKKDSPFGYHIYVNSMGRPAYYRKGQENRTKMAFLAGAKWGRIHSVDWRVVQAKNKDTYDWSFFDWLIEMPHKYKIMILGNIVSNPKWASTNKSSKSVGAIGQPTWAYSPPKKMDWEKWVETLVRRYKDKIGMWEIGNEPAYITCFWPSGSPADYAEYLKSAYKSAKKVDPECKILTGGLVSRTAVSFLKDVLKYLGTDNCFDIHGFHYSQYPKKNSYKEWRNVLAPYGGKPLINTEQSAAASDDFLQIEKMIKKQTWELANGVQKTFFFNLFLDGLDGGRNILHSGWTPRPAYAAYRTMTNRLEGAVYCGRLPLPQGIEGYLFMRKNTPVIILWSNSDKDKKGKQTVPVNLGSSSAKLIDVMDVEREVSCDKKGRLRLELSSMPVFIEGGDLDFLKAQASLNIVLKPERPLFLAGKKEELNLLINNTLSHSINIDVFLKKNDQLNIKTIDKQFTIQPKKTLTIKIPADIPQSVGKKQFSLKCSVKFHIKDKAVNVTIPIGINTAIVPPGENILENSDFSRASAFWKLRKNKNYSVKHESSRGLDSSPGLHSQTSDDKGASVFFYVKRIPVLPGEKYALIADEKRSGPPVVNVVQVSGYNKDGKRIFPSKPGGQLIDSKT